MTQVGPERVEEWFEQRQYPNSVWPEDEHRLNMHLRQLGPMSVRELVEAAKLEEYEVHQEVRNAQRGVEFVISYKVTDVEIRELCTEEDGGHDWGEWRYDFMGGDIRRCKKCNKAEMT